MQSSDATNKPTIEAPDYTDVEKAFFGMITANLQQASDDREQNHTEFDDKTYTENWEGNAKAANAYIKPRVNATDVRITSGTTHEKENTILSFILNYNFEADVEAYDDEDREVKEIGQNMEDMIRKSRQLERPDYEMKRALILHELLSQGTVFVRDTFKETSIPQRVVDSFGKKFSEIKWSDRMEKIEKLCSMEYLTGLNVYLGNVREFFLEAQPFVGIRKLIPRSLAQSIFGDWERWKNVALTKQDLIPSSQDTDSTPYNYWTLVDTDKDMVEVVEYFDKWSNQYMILLNGVMMFPVREGKRGPETMPLSSINGVSEYPIAKGDIEPISATFAYSKSIPNKTKVDQQVFDEMMKSIILKTRQSYEPPMANNTGRALSKKIFAPGTIHPDVNPEKLQPIVDTGGVTNGQFAATNFIKSIIDEKSVSPTFEGNPLSKRQTASEINKLQDQSIISLGVTILGVVLLEKKLAQLRLYNILKNWTDPIDTKLVTTKDGIKKVNQFREISVDTQFEDGTQGERVISFTEDDLPTPTQINAEKTLLEVINGKKIRKTYINPHVLKSVYYTWYIEIVPTEKETGNLKAAMFEEFMMKSIQIFAPLGMVPNLEYLATRFAELNKENPDKVWSQPQQPQAPQPGGPEQDVTRGDALEQMTAGSKKPALGQMVGADT